MSDHQALDPRLEEWLEVATRGLSKQSAGRARDELVDHWLEALDESHMSGIDDEAAVTTILESFGDPRQMGRSLRRANLRPWEAKIVADLRRPQSFRNPLPVIALVCYAALIPAFIVVTWDYVGAPWWSHGIFVASLAAMIAGFVSRFWLAAYLAKRDRLRPALAADVFGSWFYFAGLVVGSNVIAEGRATASAVVYLAILTFAIWFVAHLWPKLGRRGLG